MNLRQARINSCVCLRLNKDDNIGSVGVNMPHPMVNQFITSPLSALSPKLTLVIPIHTFEYHIEGNTECELSSCFLVVKRQMDHLGG